MRRFWVSPEQINQELITFTGDTFHHVVDVSRMKVGDKFEVLSENSQAFFVEMQNVGRKQAQAKILEQRTLPQLPKPYISLALSIPRPKNLDTIVEKSVELGVHSLRLFTSDHSFFRDPKDFPATRMERVQRIIKAANQQTARGVPLQVQPVENLQNLLKTFNRMNRTAGLFAYEGEASLEVGPYLERIKTKSFEEIWLFVGSEGGFSRAEVEAFHSTGLEPVTLGDQILRVETACVALISIIKYALQAGF